jgi:hypothetical protein
VHRTARIRPLTYSILSLYLHQIAVVLCSLRGESMNVSNFNVLVPTITSCVYFGSHNYIGCIFVVPQLHRVHICGPTITLCAYFGSHYYIVCIFWVPLLHRVYILGPTITSCVYFGSHYYIVCIFWVPLLHRVHILGPTITSCAYIGQRNVKGGVSSM